MESIKTLSSIVLGARSNAATNLDISLCHFIGKPCHVTVTIGPFDNLEMLTHGTDVD